MRSYFPWLSVLLLLLANVAFGQLLHQREVPQLIWGLAIAYIVFECGVLSVLWQPFREFVLLGFQSDMGYALMALVGASLVVVLAVWARISSYFMVMLAAGLLLRIDLFTRRVGKRLSFIALLLVSLVGIALSWLFKWLAV